MFGAEPRRIFRSVRGVAFAVGVGASARQMPALDDQIFLSDWPAFQEAFEDFPRPGGITRLADSDVPEMCGVIP